MATSPSIWEAIGQALLGGGDEAQRQRDVARQVAYAQQARQDKLTQQGIENDFRNRQLANQEQDRQLNIIKNAIENADPNQPIDPETYALANQFHLAGAFQRKPLPDAIVGLPKGNDASQVGTAVDSLTIPGTPGAVPKPTLGDASPLGQLAAAAGAPDVNVATGKVTPNPSQVAPADKQIALPQASGPVGDSVPGLTVPQNAFGFFKRQTPQEQIADAKAKLISGIAGGGAPGDTSGAPPLTPDQQRRLQFEAAGIPAGQVLGTPAPNINSYDFKPGSNEYKVSQDVAYGKLPFNNLRSLIAYSRDPGYKMAIYGKAAELNPNFNPAAYEMGLKFAIDPQTQRQLAAQDNVLNGVQSLLQASQDAARTKMPLANYFINAGGVQLGDKRYSSFQVAQKAFADELSGALGFGTASDMKLQLGLDLASPNLSPEQFMDAVQNVVVPFVQRKRDSMLTQMGRYGEADMNPAAAKAAGAPVPGVAPGQQPAQVAPSQVAPPNSGGRGAGAGSPNTLTKQDVMSRFSAKYNRQPTAAELNQAIAAFRQAGISVQ